MATHVIEMQAVFKAFGPQQVLNDIDLQVPARSVFGFLGKRGEGKSTLIRLLTGLLRADRGEIHVLGHDIRTERRMILSQIGVLVDAPGLYPNLTGAEMLRIGCTIKGLPRNEVVRVLELVNLGGAAHRQIGKYSLGMKQRLTIAHALLGSPQLLILDEPTNGLDPEGVDDIRALLRSLPAVAGTSIFLSSNHLAGMEKTATHIALLKGGRISLQAPMGELLAQQTGILAIDVSDSHRAQQLLQSAAYQAERTSTGQVRVSGVQKHQADRVHALLVHAGFKLYQSVYHTPSLEQWFMEKQHAA